MNLPENGGRYVNDAFAINKANSSVVRKSRKTKRKIKMKMALRRILYLCILRLTAKTTTYAKLTIASPATESIGNATTTDENEELEAVPLTEQVMDANIKISDLPDVEEATEEWLANWDANKVIRDVAYYLRAHKFQDYDRRYYRSFEEAPNKFYEEFPKPPLRALHWEVRRHCESSFVECLKYLERIVKLTALRRQDDTVTVMKEQKWNLANNTEQILAAQRDCQMAQRRDNLTVLPFQGPIERFQWRTTVSYYMCWYTMQGVPELGIFGESCDNHADCSIEYGARNGDPRADDAKPYACALYSFCPDHCCPVKRIRYMKDCYQSPLNPCYADNSPARRRCNLNREENRDFFGLRANWINVSCECPEAGYEWSSKFGMCIDLNECTSGTHSCSAEDGETCINMPGHYECICRLGYVYSPQSGGCVSMSMALNEWYADRQVLLTGVTSEVGRALLEKILRSFPNLKVYAVIRSRYGLNKDDRLKEIFSSPRYERLREEDPNAMSRVKALEGNLLYEGLGTSKDDGASLKKNVSVVFHAGGPHEAVFEFCQDLPRLEVLVAVSNLFRHKGRIAEAPQNERLPDLPLALVRIPLVGPAYREPMPGFVDILKGPTAFIAGAGLTLGKKELEAEVIPIDIAINTLVVAAWERGTAKSVRGPMIYNAATIGCKWNDLIKKGRRGNQKFAYPTFGFRGMTSNVTLHWILVLLLEWLPSVLCDRILSFGGGKQRFFLEYERARNALRSLESISSRPWPAERKRVHKLQERLTPEEQDAFPVATEIDIESYVLCATAAARKYCAIESNISFFKIFRQLFLLLIAAGPLCMIFYKFNVFARERTETLRI